MNRVIINADDFGINELVTSEIERMINFGLISSTTVMANGQCLEEVKRFAALHPDISFGAHLCLSEFDCITRNKELLDEGLIDEQGKFVKGEIFEKKYFRDNLKLSLADEINAQIDIIQSLGITISHADSHHHVHTIYPLRHVFAEVLRQRGIKKIRLGVNFVTPRQKLHLYQWYKREKLNDYFASKFITCKEFSPYSKFVFSNRSYDEHTIELMCHPGHPGKVYREEMELVESNALSKIINYELISYNDL